AGTIRDNRLADKLRYSQNLVNRGTTPQNYQAAEGEISQGIDDLRKKLDEASAALGQGEKGDKMENALERARRLARAAESLQERTRERGQRGPGQGQRQDQNGDQQARNGQQGQQGQGQQGQGSQSAQNGQAGGQ